jgi:hypothetical protein
MQMGEIMLQGPSKAGLYPIYLKHFSSNKSHSLVAFIGVKAPVSVWHNRLGHPSSSVFQHLLRHSQLSVSGSQRQESFSISSCVSNFPLELIHSDVWTSPVESISGCKFYVLFVDNFSRFTWLFPLKHKSDVFVCFLKFKCLVENLLSRKIKQL